MDKFYEERVRRLRERVLSHENNVKAETEVTLDEIKDETIDVGELKVKDIKELLDKKGIEYKANANKDELLKLLPF